MKLKIWVNEIRDLAYALDMIQDEYDKVLEEKVDLENEMKSRVAELEDEISELQNDNVSLSRQVSELQARQ